MIIRRGLRFQDLLRGAQDGSRILSPQEVEGDLGGLVALTSYHLSAITGQESVNT